MSEANSPGVSRASMDQRWQQSTGRANGDSASREGLVTEAQRATAGPDVVAFYAAQNPAINIERSYLNIDMVNDGQGGFRRTASIAEVVAYGDARAERVKPGMKAGNTFAVTGVYHLPWAYVEPDGTTYRPVGKDGSPRVDADGRPVMLPRYRIKPERHDEAMAYFDAVIEYKASLLPDGQRGIHGYSINLDESRPHLQEISDTFYSAPSKKSPDAMRNGFSRAFGRHPKDPLVEITDPETGKTRMVREDASLKMERYHREFKQFLIERGFEVEAERDEVRHARKLSLDDYKDVEGQRAVVAALEAEVENAARAIEAERAAVDEADIALTVAEAELDQYQTVLDDVALSAVVTAERTRTEAELVAEAIAAEAEADAAGVRERAEAAAGEQFERGYRRGMSKGRSEGRAVGRREAEEVVATAQVEADQIRDNAIADIEVTRRRIEEEQADRERAVEYREREAALTQAAAREAIGKADAEAEALTAARARVEAGAAAWDDLTLDDMNHYVLSYMEETTVKNGDSLLDIAKRGGKKKFMAENPGADPASSQTAYLTRQEVADQYRRGESEAKGQRRAATQRQTDRAGQINRPGQTPNY